ncbi:MAG TPA: Ig-like domain-containing protein [Coriobacteriia bacterium]
MTVFPWRRPTRPVIRAVMVGCAALALVMASAASAFAATAFTNAAPTAVPNTVNLNSVTVQVHASDPAEIRSASLTLDGVAKTPAVNYDGYWTGNGCDTWFVADPTNATVSYKIPSAAVGPHEVTVSVTNGAGAVASESWSFSVAGPDTTFTTATPAPGSTITVWDPAIGVSLQDPAGVSDGPSVTLDGVTHPVAMLFGDQRISMDTWNDIIYNALPWEVPTVDWSKGYVTFTPSSLPDGPHEVTVRAGNNTGRTATHSWSFTVAAPPKITAMLPVDGSSVPTQSPRISANVADNGTIASMKMLVDGAQVPATYDSTTKTFSYAPGPLSNDRQHTVRVEATDAGGLKATAEWKFTVQVYADMPVSSTCETCHDATKHPMSKCEACHNVVYIGHGPGGPVSWCLTCHHIGSHGPNVIIPGVTWGGGDTPQPGYTGYWGNYCDYCHNAKYASIPRHPDDNAAFHDTKADVSACAPCHVRSLTREHYRYAKDGKQLSCDICHGPNAPDKVKAAVSSGDTACTACHDFASSGDPHEAVHTPTGLSWQCTMCHTDSLISEHMTNWTSSGKGIGCQSCHASVDGRVVWAIFAGDKKCSACHVSAHALGLAPAPTGIPQYPGYRWSQPIDTTLFAGESWLAPGFATRGLVIVSDRRTDVTPAQVWEFYAGQMPAAGWMLASGAPASGDTAFKATFTKGSHSVVLWCYGGEGHAAAPVVSTGYRVEVLYR